MGIRDDIIYNQAQHNGEWVCGKVALKL